MELLALQALAVRALATMGKKADALALAEASRGPWTSESDVVRLCQAILLSSEQIDEAESTRSTPRKRARVVVKRNADRFGLR